LEVRSPCKLISGKGMVACSSRASGFMSNIHITKDKRCFTREDGKQQYCKLNGTPDCIKCSVFAGNPKLKNLFTA
jgi:hypothetical protein